MCPADVDHLDLPLAQVFRLWPETASVFLKHRTACFGCPIAPFHTIADTCREYGLDEASLREELRDAIGEG